MADNTRYAFIGYSQNLPGGSGGYTVPDGYGGILVASNDPNIEQVMNRARSLGLKVGIFIPTDLAAEPPEDYAQHLAQVYAKYHPDTIMPDLEAEAKGYPGTPQWDWNQKMSDAFHKLAPDAHMSVTVMGNQDDFNYGAYTKYGADIHAQAYGSNPYDPAEQYDPQQIYDTLIRNGVPPDQAHVVVAPGQQGVGSGGSVFTLDQMSSSGTVPQWQEPAPGTNAASAAPQPNAAPAQTTAVPADIPQSTHPGSAQAEAYAKKRLTQMAKLGILPQEGVQIGPGGYAQAWRNLSATINAPAQAAGYRDPGFWLRQASQQNTLTPNKTPGLPTRATSVPTNSPYYYGGGGQAPTPPAAAPAPASAPMSPHEVNPGLITLMTMHPYDAPPAGPGPTEMMAHPPAADAIAAARARIMQMLQSGNYRY